MPDIVERAYLISKNKSVFFDQEALTEANRYVAALYTAIAYNQPRCVELILAVVGRRDVAKHSFFVSDEPPVLESLEAGELAHTLGNVSCIFNNNLCALFFCCQLAKKHASPIGRLACANFLHAVTQRLFLAASTFSYFYVVSMLSCCCIFFFPVT